MIEDAWEKRGVLKAMVSDHLNTNKTKFLIEDEEWEPLKMFADELFAFYEANSGIFLVKLNYIAKCIRTLWTSS